MIEQTSKKNKRPFRALRAKLRSRRGTTLMETLMAVLIMSILGSALTTGMLVSAKSFTKALRGMEKDTLFSTLQYVISYELQYSTSITVDPSNNNSVIDVQAKTYGKEEYEDADAIRRTFFANNGRIVYGIEGDECQPILSKNAYPDGMTARVDTLTYDPLTHFFHVELSVLYKNSVIVDKVGFDVLNLYSTEPKRAEA